VGQAHTPREKMSAEKEQSCPIFCSGADQLQQRLVTTGSNHHRRRSHRQREIRSNSCNILEVVQCRGSMGYRLQTAKAGWGVQTKNMCKYIM
jgi:hypothetical protein